jgi:hypothetical protein
MSIMSYNMMIGYDIYDHFTMKHFPLRQYVTIGTLQKKVKKLTLTVREFNKWIVCSF